jgi:hypothetical protein
LAGTAVINPTSFTSDNISITFSTAGDTTTTTRN